jgi:hypothetical protein
MWILISHARNGIGQIFFMQSCRLYQNPRSVAVNHAGLWIRRHQFESGRGYSWFSLPGFRKSTAFISPGKRLSE